LIGILTLTGKPTAGPKFPQIVHPSSVKLTPSLRGPAENVNGNVSIGGSSTTEQLLDGVGLLQRLMHAKTPAPNPGVVNEASTPPVARRKETKGDGGIIF
jgi:hypothetical protein